MSPEIMIAQSTSGESLGIGPVYSLTLVGLQQADPGRSTCRWKQGPLQCLFFRQGPGATIQKRKRIPPSTWSELTGPSRPER